MKDSKIIFVSDEWERERFWRDILYKKWESFLLMGDTIIEQCLSSYGSILKRFSLLFIIWRFLEAFLSLIFWECLIFHVNSCFVSPAWGLVAIYVSKMLGYSGSFVVNLYQSGYLIGKATIRIVDELWSLKSLIADLLVVVPASVVIHVILGYNNIFTEIIFGFILLGVFIGPAFLLRKYIELFRLNPKSLLYIEMEFFSKSFFYFDGKKLMGVGVWEPVVIDLYKYNIEKDYDIVLKEVHCVEESYCAYNLRCPEDTLAADYEEIRIYKGRFACKYWHMREVNKIIIYSREKTLIVLEDCDTENKDKSEATYQYGWRIRFIDNNFIEILKQEVPNRKLVLQ